MAQLFLNNLETQFIAPVSSVALTGSPDTELGYGILQISDGAAGALINPGSDYYVLTAFKRAGTVESNVEVMRVTAVNNSVPGECRITVTRAQEGTAAQSYVSGDKLALRLTAGAVNNWVQDDDPRMSNSRAPNGTAGGVLSGSFPNPVFAEDMATQSELNAHTGSTSNPHSVTKAQVGLGNVDNTSDANKPVSTATQTALDGKQAAGSYALTTDSRFTDSRTPTGTAGGVLSGTYPSPGFAVDMATQAELDAVSSAKQNTLVSGTNIKTVNGTSLLGSGDITVSSSSGNSGANMWVTTSATTFTVPTGVTSIRAYAIGGGGNGFRDLTQTLAGGGGGGGMAFGDIAVTPGATVTVGIASGVATVTYSGTTMLTANNGATATSGVRGVGGTASKHAAVTNGGAYTGGSGATGSQGAGGGGAATPLGNGATSGDYGGGALAKGGTNVEAGSGAGGAASGVVVGGPSRSLQNACTDFLLRGANGCGGSFVTGATTGEPGEPGGGGAGVSGTTAVTTTGGAGGDFGGGGGAYSTSTSSITVRGGAGGFLGGGGGASASNVTPIAYGGAGGIGGGGGGVGSTNTGIAGTGGSAAVVIFY
jgi:hypothetical protein